MSSADLIKRATRSLSNISHPRPLEAPPVASSPNIQFALLRAETKVGVTMNLKARTLISDANDTSESIRKKKNKRPFLFSGVHVLATSSHKNFLRKVKSTGLGEISTVRTSKRTWMSLGLLLE
tara:strand:- start:224 stop:592 length:369 start_codon:yes stop_codon:yes gene_type:complete